MLLSVQTADARETLLRRNHKYLYLMESLDVRHQRMIYLITYSRAEKAKVPTRQAFAGAVVKGFECNT